MSAWRKKAIELLPEAKKDIERSKTPTAAWVNSYHHFLVAHSKATFNEDLIGRFYKYAKWCLTENGSADVKSAAFIGFYENLPLHEQVIRIVDRWIEPSFFSEIKEAFKYHSSPEVFEKLEKIYSSKRRR